MGDYKDVWMAIMSMDGDVAVSVQQCDQDATTKIQDCRIALTTNYCLQPNDIYFL
jgi:hypothetical protein